MNRSTILFESEKLNALQRLQRSLSSVRFKNATFVTLLDSNTYTYCFSTLISTVGCLQESHWIEVENAEQGKSIQTVADIWQALLELEADRNMVLINLGGGAISDLGGFVASTYKRGIRFITIPTTLLSMVDASIGGKTAVNFLGIKNPIGTFQNPEYVCIVPEFLQSLPKKEIKSGVGEMLKTALLADAGLWVEMKQQKIEAFVKRKDFIYRCAQIKKQITDKDPLEKNIRKALNLGHSIGHAIESLSMQTEKNKLMHGEAVAFGLLCEIYISTKKVGFPVSDFKEIEEFVCRNFGKKSFSESNIELMLSFLRNDKKNTSSKINMSLLYQIEKPALNIQVSEDEAIESLRYLSSL